MTLGPNHTADLLSTLRNALELAERVGGSVEMRRWLGICIDRVEAASKRKKPKSK